MKLILPAIIFVCLSGDLFAQSILLPENQKLNPGVLDKRVNLESIMQLDSKHSKTRSGSGFWLNYVEDYRNVILVEPVLKIMPLFPDTNIYGINKAKPFYHYAATLFDPFHMNDFYDIKNGDSYTLDSVGFRYSYIRRLDSAIVDTLVLSVIKHSNYVLCGNQTICWEDIRYDYINNILPDSQVWKTFTYALTESDSTDIKSGTYLIKEMHLPVTGVPEIDYPDVVGFALSFRPGYSYSLASGDSIYGKNGFALLTSKQEQGKEKLYSATNKNVSYIVETGVRYNYDPIGFNSHFIPSYAYSGADAFENHYISFFITSIDKLGVNDLSVSNGIIFSPNPVDDKAYFKYHLTEKTIDVTMRVFDISGREMLAVNAGTQIPGDHKIDLDFTQLNPGMYFYQFDVDGKSARGKFVVK